MELNRIIKHNVLDPWPLEDQSVQCIVTSPPYFNLRDYKVDGQIGIEKTPEEYIAKLVSVFQEAWRVLKDDGTLWVNIGDCYASSGGKRTVKQATAKSGLQGGLNTQIAALRSRGMGSKDIKTKDIIGIPWMLCFALRAESWYWRQEITWAKTNCMPESAKDRCTRSHEALLMFSKSPKYYYDHRAIQEPAIYDTDGTGTAARKARQKVNGKSMATAEKAGIRPEKQRGHSRRHAGFNDRWDKMTTQEQCTGMRNKRDVWFLPTAQFPEAHYAVMPEELALPCILAGTKPGDIVLDPFMGAGTTALVAAKNARKYIGFELNPENIEMSLRRLKKEHTIFHTQNTNP